MGKQTFIKLAFAAFALVSLSQCGNKKGKSEGVKVSIIPEKPIVITASIPGDGLRTKPWFDFEVELENTTTQSFTILAVEAEISGQDSSGTRTTQTFAWAPAQLNYSNAADGTQCSYTSFGTWAPNERKTLRAAGTTGCATFTSIPLPAGSNPTGLTGKNYRYQVKLKPLGYFIDVNNKPDDRLEKFKYFFTQ